MRIAKLTLLVCAAAAAQTPIDWQAALNRVSADSLKGHLSFLASDLLEGRDTPSQGLDIAAEYIAAQFRRAGLEPAGNEGYFHTSTWYVVEQGSDGFQLELESGARKISVPVSQAVLNVSRAIDIAAAPVFKVELGGAEPAGTDVAGKVVVLVVPSQPNLMRPFFAFRSAMQKLKPACVILADPDGYLTGTVGRKRPYATEPASIPSPAGFEMVSVRNTEVARMLASSEPATARLRVPEPRLATVKLRNVLGLLRGSDPALRETYVMVNAHYDHIGTLAPGPGDRVYNGANDDGSGTVSVLEVAAALGALPVRPKRSILFGTFFGEEKGILGARQFARNPPFPIGRIAAALTLEQTGRTDSTEGPQINSANLTGFDFSDLSRRLVEAGKQAGVRVWKHEASSDAFFSRSDNIALAEAGVPSHTLSVAYNYPDYHGLGDHWDKIDYDNMARVVRAVALGLLLTADDPVAPEWNAENPRTERYRKAAEAIRAPRKSTE
ncbi:MAG: M28 family peptidase [Acidimicrobiia bacterium]|nr:M28 family peptidase [Acidimicrobiia bacterium]